MGESRLADWSGATRAGKGSFHRTPLGAISRLRGCQVGLWAQEPLLPAVQVGLLLAGAGQPILLDLLFQKHQGEGRPPLEVCDK